MKANAIVNEVPMVKDLGKNGPIAQFLRDRLESDLSQAQCILGSMREICEHGIGDTNQSVDALVAVESMAYRVGRMLEVWTGTGYFGDVEERRIEAAQPA